MSAKKDNGVIISLVVVIALEAVGWFISVGVVMSKMDALELRVSDTEDAIDNLHKVNDRLIRIEVLMETVVVGNNSIKENQAVFGAEQQKRGPLIDEAIRHVRDSRK